MSETLNDALARTVETARDAERDLFGALDAATRERPIRPDDWNPKDFQAHLTAWKGRQADRFAAVREGRELPPPIDDVEEDALNAQLRATKIDVDWDAIVHEADEVTARLVTEIRQADPDALRASDRLVAGTFGNGVLHTLTHVRWLVEADVPLDPVRVATYAREVLEVVNAAPIPGPHRAIGLYDLACYHALSASTETAKALLQDAFALDPQLREFSRTDPDLTTVRDDLESLTD